MKFAAIVASALAVATAVAAAGEHHAISSRRAAERKAFSDAEIAEGFFKVAFGAELRIAGTVDRIRKFEAPVRVHVDNRARPDRRAGIAAVVADIRARVQHLDIAMAGSAAEANTMVTLVRNRDLARTIKQIYGRWRARLIERSLAPQCLSSFRKDERFRIVESRVIIVADAGDFVFYDCAYEELLQALGPINDTNAVPWTMFNDRVHMGFFDVYDQYILNILYDPRIRTGMSPDEVRALLPQVLPEVRAWVARVNNLAP
jgi:NAD(P)-dependent dehydrogenase (short-subunit alcohol dehydrogenase family)